MELQEKKHDKIIAKLEQDHKILLYASTDVTRELQFINIEWAIGTKLYSYAWKVEHNSIQEASEDGADNIENRWRLDNIEYAKIT